MTRCEHCGAENRDEARFCDSCGGALQPAAPERRKLATLLFCDMSGSTAMGERVDAESVRDLMFSYFHEMRGAIERHGGTVEKFIGDAVMAVFGVPLSHEDDALRACRAALEMRERLQLLNASLEQRFGSRIALRIGVNTGEVVAGDASTRQALVTGDAVNVAARLEQAASPGEILIGEETFRLCRDALEAEPVEPLALKGKSEPLPAYRLLAVSEAAPARARRLDTPLVGRAHELSLLEGELARARAGEARLATLLGEPGVGKSRLAAELLARAQADFQIFSGRCLPYGEGITYWALAEIVHQAAGIRDEHSREQALARIELLVPPRVAAVVGQAIGLAEGEAGTNEIVDATTELVRSLASERPVLLVVDDIHWGESALLELLANLPAELPHTPLALLCLARPELLEQHPSWKATVRLEPLEEDASVTLVEHLLGEATLPAGLAKRISQAAAGNPLFVEELIGMLVDDGLIERRNGGWKADAGLAELTIPATLRELLGARLDQLPQGERSALERGAVEGQVFHRGAVAALSDPSETVGMPDRLSSLVEREFLRSAPADFADDAAYRVRHILIRDAAYEAIPKKLRSELHALLANWLEAKVGERAIEHEEILGYHLEQAFRYREELGLVTPADRILATRAAERLGAAGTRALARRDASAAINLLLRSADLRPAQDSTRLEQMESAAHLLVDSGDLARAASMFGIAFGEAVAADNGAMAARLEMFRVWTQLLLDPGEGIATMLEVGERLEPALEEARDDLSLAKLHDMRAYLYDLRRLSAEVVRETETAIAHARRAGSRFHELEFHWWLFWQLPQGPIPVEEAIQRCHELRGHLDGDEAAEAAFFESLAQLEAMSGRFEEARRSIAVSIENRDRLGLHFLTTKYALPAHGLIELLAGEPAAAESPLRRACEEAMQSGDREVSSNAASLLIEALLVQDRPTDVEPLLEIAEYATAGDAVGPHVRSLSARAGVLIGRGDYLSAVDAARKAVGLVLETDDINLQATAQLRFADALSAANRVQEAMKAAEQAVQLFERKGNIVSAEGARRYLSGLAPARLSE